MIFICLYTLVSCMLCFHVWTHVWFHLILNLHMVRTFGNRIPFQTFEKWHNVSYPYVSYVKPETFNIWRTGAWILMPFWEQVEENHIFNLIKPNYTETNYTETTSIQRLQCVLPFFFFFFFFFFWNGNIEFRSKNVSKPKLMFSLNQH